MNRKSKWLVVSLIIISIGITMIWLKYSAIISPAPTVITDQVRGKDTQIKKSPGEPLENLTELKNASILEN